MTSAIRIYHNLLRVCPILPLGTVGNTDDCFMCGKPYKLPGNKDVPMSLPCGHVIGSVCVLAWLLKEESNMDCPRCKERISDL